MPAVAVRAEPRDAAPDRLELRLATAPEPEEDLRRVVAVRDLVSECRAVRGTEHAIGHTRPALDLPDPLDVHAHVAKARHRHEEQVIAVSDAEAEASGSCCARELRLPMQTENDRHRRRRSPEQAAEHLAQPQSTDGESTRDVHVLVPLESLALRRIEHHERIPDCSIIRLQRGAAHEHLATIEQSDERGVRPHGEADAKRIVRHAGTVDERLRVDSGAVGSASSCCIAATSSRTVCDNSCSECVLATKNRKRAARLATAGATIGCTFTPAASNMAANRVARRESPTMTGITGVSALAPVSSPSSRQRARKYAARLRSVDTRCGSAMSLRSEASAAAALEGGMPTL